MCSAHADAVLFQGFPHQRDIRRVIFGQQDFASVFLGRSWIFSALLPGRSSDCAFSRSRYPLAAGPSALIGCRILHYDVRFSIGGQYYRATRISKTVHHVRPFDV